MSEIAMKVDADIRIKSVLIDKVGINKNTATTSDCL